MLASFFKFYLFFYWILARFWYSKDIIVIQIIGEELELFKILVEIFYAQFEVEWLFLLNWFGVFLEIEAKFSLVLSTGFFEILWRLKVLFYEKIDWKAEY